MDFAIRVGDWLSPFRISRIAISSCSDGLGVESLTDTNNPKYRKRGPYQGGESREKQIATYANLASTREN